MSTKTMSAETMSIEEIAFLLEHTKCSTRSRLSNLRCRQAKERSLPFCCASNKMPRYTPVEPNRISMQ
jgi:hypothetical protein